MGYGLCYWHGILGILFLLFLFVGFFFSFQLEGKRGVGLEGEEGGLGLGARGFGEGLT